MIVLALASTVDAHAVGGLAEALGLEVVQIVMEDEDTQQRDVLLATDDRATTVRYVQDFYLELGYVVLDGPDAEAFAVRFAEAGFVLDPDALLAEVHAGLDPKDREAMKTLVRLALTAAPERRPAVLVAFSDVAAAADEAPAFTLVSALSVLALWPGALLEARPVLVHLAAHPSEMVREEAQVLSAAFEQYLRRN